jgi:hypothetical protein
MHSNSYFERNTKKKPKHEEEELDNRQKKRKLRNKGKRELARQLIEDDDVRQFPDR